MINQNKGLLLLCLLGSFGFSMRMIAHSKHHAKSIVIAKVVADKVATEKFDIGSRDGASKALLKIAESLSGADKDACLKLAALVKNGGNATTADVISIAGKCNLSNLAKAYDDLKAKGCLTGNIFGLEQMMRSKNNPYMAARNAAQFIKSLKA